MRRMILLWILYTSFPQITQGGGCNDFTGNRIRDYDSTNVVGSAMSANEDSTGLTGMEMVFDHADYATTCACGIVTMWQFFAWKPGTVVFYVLDGTSVVGTFSVTIGDQSDENFFEVPMSSDLWIPIRSGYRLGFFTADIPMMTYQSVSSYNSGYYNSGRTLGTTVLSSGTTTTNRKYAVAAYISEAHSPVFVNAPFRTSVYNHNVGQVVYKATVLDVDGTDTLTVTKSGNAAFSWDASTLELTYASKRNNNNSISVSLTVDDGCTASSTKNVRIQLLDEGPTLLNLPASTTVLETDTSGSTTVLYTILYTDPDDSVTCSIDSTNPATSNFDISGDNIRSVSPTYDFSAAPYYDLRIRCNDGVNDVYSNFQVDVVRNEPPFFNLGAGYLPASISVDVSGSTSIYNLDWDDPEGHTVSVASISLVGGGSPPFSTSGSVVSTTSQLTAEGYDLAITVQDQHGATTGPYILSIIVSGRPNTFNAAPQFVNLPYTKHVMENSPVGTFLFKVMFTDENPADTVTLSKTSSTAADTYLTFDPTTGFITVTANIDYESVPASFTMTIQADDGTDSTSGTITFVSVNVNEGMTLTIGSPSLSADETTVSGTLVGNPGISVVDIDSGDTLYFSMNCGDDSKYFYLSTADNMIYFAREYDMDAGLPGNATCNITVRDEGGLTDSGLVQLTINNVNDHRPKFPQNVYVFFVTTSTTFFTEISNMSATDDDSDSHGSANGLLLYHFDPALPTEYYFQIDAAGILFARNLTSYPSNYYIFSVVATDDLGLTGTCTVTVIFSERPTTTTTTTERTLVFTDDYQNYFWLLLLGIVLFTGLFAIGLIVWKDPKVNAYVSFQMIRLNGWCRKKPKVREPKRHVGKLTVSVNNKHLENDPDNALPWELLAKDADVPEMNVVQAEIEERKERKDRDYKNFAGLPVFEKGKGERPESARTTGTSTSGTTGRPDSESPKYATFMPQDKDKERTVDEGGEGQWGNLPNREEVVLTPVVSYQGTDDWE